MITDMKEIVTGWISLLGSIGYGLFFISIAMQGNLKDEYFIFIGLIFYFISTCLYVIWTNFGNKVDPKIKIIEVENEILKKQIEQKELKKKLED